MYGWLFQIGVFVGAQRGRGDLNVEVIGGGNENRVHVLVVEQLLIFDSCFGCRDVLFEMLLERGDLFVVDVAKGANVHAWILGESVGDDGAAPAETDNA